MNSPKGKKSSDREPKKFFESLMERELEAVMESKLIEMDFMDVIRKECEATIEQKMKCLETSMALKEKKIFVILEEWRKLVEDLSRKLSNLEEQNKILKSEIEKCKRRDEQTSKCWQNVEKRLKELSTTVTDIKTLRKEQNAGSVNKELQIEHKCPSLEARMTNLEESLHKALHVMLPRVDSVLSTMSHIPKTDGYEMKATKDKDKQKKTSSSKKDKELSKDSPRNVSVSSGEPSTPTANLDKLIAGKNNLAIYEVNYLLNSVKNNEIDGVVNLLNRGFYVNACNEDGFTALHAAAEFGLIEITSLLLARGADVHFKDDSGKTPIFNAASNRHVGCISLLVRAGADVNAKAKDGTTALHHAALCGDGETIRTLLSKGAVTSAADFQGWTPLHWAVVWGSEETTGALLETECNIGVRDAQGKTPLQLAVVSGRSNTAKLLIEAGASISEVHKGNMTPSELHITEKVIKELKHMIRNENVSNPMTGDERNKGGFVTSRKKKRAHIK